MIRSLSETVIVPIAGIILTFVMCYELIQLIIEKNNLHDFDTWIFFKWIFKTFCAVLIVTNTWNIVMAVFDVAQNVVSQSAGVIISDAGIDISGVVGDLETQLADWSVGALLGLWFQSVFVGLCTQILSICIFLVIYGRMIEVYLVTSMAWWAIWRPSLPTGAWAPCWGCGSRACSWGCVHRYFPSASSW